jgi:hypothetical protein
MIATEHMTLTGFYPKCPHIIQPGQSGALHLPDIIQFVDCDELAIR